MNSSGAALLLLLVAPLCGNIFAEAGYFSFAKTSAPSTSYWKMASCVVNQVPKLPPGFNKPLYQYLFETFAKNTHLLPLGVPMQSRSEDFESTAQFERCLWGKTTRRNGAAASDDGEYEDEEAGNGLDAETKEAESSAYHQLFASRQGGYDSLTGFSLLGGKIVAALVGYIVYALSNTA